MRKYILLAVILLIGIAFFFFGGNTNNNEYKVFKNAVMPTPVQIAGFALGDDVPFLAVNLLKFKEKAEYGDGRETNLTGAQAYAIYADEVRGHLAKVGAEPIFGGEVNRLILGEVEELWDWVAIAEYPNKKAMRSMIMNKEYQKSEEHRSAGLAGQLNLETRPHQ
jgi:uncharacterized protein (DUF1330 family)